jgi:hypothetical protein
MQKAKVVVIFEVTAGDDEDLNRIIRPEGTLEAHLEEALDIPEDPGSASGPFWITGVKLMTPT